jgi:hypothetical protein
VHKADLGRYSEFVGSAVANTVGNPPLIRDSQRYGSRRSRGRSVEMLSRVFTDLRDEAENVVRSAYLHKSFVEKPCAQKLISRTPSM